MSILFTQVFTWGLTGLFYASGIAPISAGIILGIYYYSGKWRTHKISAVISGKDNAELNGEKL